MLCQIFICIDTPGNPDTRPHRPAYLLEEAKAGHGWLMTAILDKTYCLTKLFGITRPSTSARKAAEEEIKDLEAHIRLNDPEALVSDLEVGEDRLAGHHTCTFFCATLIYFERCLQRTLPRKLQPLVRRSLDHFDAVRQLEVQHGYKACGLLWPEFVTAYEAKDVADLRTRSFCLFNKGRAKGIGNVLSMEKVVLDVWQRRDDSAHDEDVGGKVRWWI
ncbi:uncharacterized protein PV06_11492 [Exophiala oligosperma]|uniref:Uncharacterized protein n=1 Tax=Exophiala oligosperma TaxID=215243 RepID=A0A0D2D1X2_9EURO|nr:uncharacterized protein PV06_11492 [Exophiala oligosperma]KIW36220.1 hypothetical protein PV06_11492 [Exophiala oligosperma]